MTIHHPLLASFIQEVESRYDQRSPQTLWSCESAFKKILSLDLLTHVINQELGALAQDVHYFGGWQSNEMLLHKGPGYALMLSLFQGNRRYIHVQPYYGMLAPLKGGLEYDLYQMPAAYRNEVFDPSITLKLAGSGRTPEGQILKLQTDQFSYDFRGGKSALGLKLITAPMRALEWLFSRDSLRAWQANDSDIHFTQLRVGAYLLGRFAQQSSLSPLKKITEHPQHAVRWAAIQALGRISRTEALAALKQAVRDPHPHIQKAAAKTLEQLEKKKAG